MPAGISALAAVHVGFETLREPEMDLGNTKAFTILQKDGLDSSLPLLHVNGLDDSDDEDDEDDDSVASRMTAIRRNFRNNDSSVFEHRELSKSNEYLVPPSQPVSNRLHRGCSKSQGHLNRQQRAPEFGARLTSMHLSTEDFNEVLSAKLRKIQQEAEEEQRRQAARANHVQHPKPFITTVKSGEFLMPPPEVAVLLGIAPNLSDSSDGEGAMHCRSRFRQQLVSLNRKPETRHQAHNSRCQMALKATEDFGLWGSSGVSALSTARKSFKKESLPPT